MSKADRRAGRERALAAVASYERELAYWLDRGAQLFVDRQEARADEDEARVEAIDNGLAAARFEALRCAREAEDFRHMAAHGWEPPDPESVETLKHTDAIKRDNLAVARQRGHDPGYWERSLGETRLRLTAAQAQAREPRRRDRRMPSGRPAGRRSTRRASSASSGDPPDLDDDPDLAPLAGATR